MAQAQLHELKMTPGTTAEDYTAQFEMLTGRTSFNDTALEDIRSRSPQLQFHSAEDFCSDYIPQWLGCEGDTETRPLVYRDSLRQGQAKQISQCDT